MEKDAESFQLEANSKKLLAHLKRDNTVNALNLPNKTPLYYQGEELPFVFVIQQGAVKLSRVNHKGDQLTSAILEIGEIFGPGLWDEGNSEAQETAICKGSTQLFRVSNKEFRAILTTHPDLAWHFIQRLIKRQLQSERRLEAILYQNVKNRLVGFLYERVLSYEQLNHDDNGIEIRLRQQELADLIGASRPVVSTILKEFKTRGVLSTTRDVILIEDVAAIKRLSTR